MSGREPIGEVVTSRMGGDSNQLLYFFSLLLLRSLWLSPSLAHCTHSLGQCNAIQWQSKECFKITRH